MFCLPACRCCAARERTVGMWTRRADDIWTTYRLLVSISVGTPLKFQPTNTVSECYSLTLMHLCVWKLWSSSSPFSNIRSVVRKTANNYSEGKVKDITHIDKWRKTKTEPCADSFCLLISLLAMCSSAACVYSVWLIIPSNDWFTGTACYLWMYDYRDHDVPADNFHAHILFPPVSLLYYF